MKKTLIGILFLGLAALVLFQGQFGFPYLNINIWTLAVIAGFAYFSIENFLKRNMAAGFFFCYKKYVEPVKEICILQGFTMFYLS